MDNKELWVRIGLNGTSKPFSIDQGVNHELEDPIVKQSILLFKKKYRVEFEEPAYIVIVEPSIENSVHINIPREYYESL